MTIINGAALYLQQVVGTWPILSGVMSDTVFVPGWPRSFPACDPTLGGKMSPTLGGKIISIMGGKMSPIMGGKIISIMGGKLAKITVKSIEKWQYNKLINREHDMLRK